VLELDEPLGAALGNLVHYALPCSQRGEQAAGKPSERRRSEGGVAGWHLW
jgi:hypothetical protein